MRQLLLLRHGEAEPASAGSSDADRVLTATGRNEVEAAAAAIAAAQLSIDRVLVSTARRTLQTAALLTERLHLAAPPDPQDGLYLAAPHGLLQALARCPPASHTILLIGHNPGLSELIDRLTDGDEADSLRTAGICLLTFSHDGWRDLAADIADSYKFLR